MGRDISWASITQCPSPGQEPITCDIRTWVNRRNNVDMLCLTSFSLSSMLASNLDKSTEKRFQNNIGRQKAGTRAMWPKLSVTDCSLRDSRSLYLHVNAPSHRRGGALRDDTRNGCGGADYPYPVTLEDKECDVTLPNCLEWRSPSRLPVYQKDSQQSVQGIRVLVCWFYTSTFTSMQLYLSSKRCL